MLCRGSPSIRLCWLVWRLTMSWSVYIRLCWLVWRLRIFSIFQR